MRFALGEGSAAKRVVLVHEESGTKRVLVEVLRRRYTGFGNDVCVTVPS